MSVHHPVVWHFLRYLSWRCWGHIQDMSSQHSSVNRFLTFFKCCWHGHHSVIHKLHLLLCFHHDVWHANVNMLFDSSSSMDHPTITFNNDNTATMAMVSMISHFLWLIVAWTCEWHYIKSFSINCIFLCINTPHLCLLLSCKPAWTLFVTSLICDLYVIGCCVYHCLVLI